MKILIGGGSGLIGQALRNKWEAKGHEVYVLTRDPRAPHHIRWDIKEGKIWSEEKFDAVVNLTGAGIVDKAWTKAYRETIISSRTQSTATLDAYFQVHGAPDVYINASAVGIYGDHPTYEFKEEDKAFKQDFMVEVCEAWEKAVEDMKTTIAHRYILRIGIVLSADGGAFPQLSQGRQVGVVPHLGHGNQYYSWIHIDDVVGIFDHCLEAKPSSGIYNAAGPHPATNKAIAQSIAKKTGLGISPPVPAFMVHLMLGERKIAVLGSTRASSDKIESTGYTFKFPDLDMAIEDVLS
jgi:uncharacterized protein (TIGR01777 family)